MDFHDQDHQDAVRKDQSQRATFADPSSSPQAPRPVSPVPSCVSMKSMNDPLKFSSGPPQSDPNPQAPRAVSPVPSCVSMKSMNDPLKFSSGPPRSDPNPQTPRPVSPVPSCVSMKSMNDPLKFNSGPPQSDPNVLGNALTQDQSRCGITRAKPKLPDDHVLNRVLMTHKASMKRRFENICEGIIRSGTQTLLNKIYTELYITEGESEGVNNEHEVWQVESASRPQTTEDTSINCNDIFKPLPGQERHIRTVMTKGIAGIGKTVSVQKFILDWAEERANLDVDFMLVLPFRELNLVKHDQYSLHRLLLDFHPELKELQDGEYKDCHIVFIFDGLDESRLPLNFKENQQLSDVTQKSSVDVLMTSLIQGALVPSALLWITSRPAAASQIPSQCISLVTEVRGFNDPQKEEYFRKRISDPNQANRIISHIKASRSLHIMCHMPVFCWISATVLQQILEQGKKGKEAPKTLTEMFIHFLLIQTTRKDQKYQKESETDRQRILESHKGVILKLAELAFRNLENGNLMFYEEDLRECGIDVSEASVYSGMCTEIFREECVFHHKKVYCFVHLSIQEFLAAMFVFHSYISGNLEGLKSFLIKRHGHNQVSLPLHILLKRAVDKALDSKNGHLDLFLRFLVGVSVESNQALLQGLLTKKHISSESIEKTCQYIKVLKGKSPERCINLLHCLFEMNDHSIHQEVQTYLKSPNDFSGELTPAHCSALAHMLLLSEEVLDELDLSKYKTSDEGRRRLVPAVRCCRKAILSGCKLTEISCKAVASALQSSTSLKELDLSDNDLKDSGVQLLCAGLSSPHCKLQTLRLSKCGISDEGYVLLALTLMSNPSCVKDLDVSNNHPGESAQKLLSATLEDPHRKVEAIQLNQFHLSKASCEMMASVLQKTPSHLRELDMSDNDLQDEGVELLCVGLRDPQCRLETLRLNRCNLSKASCEMMASVLQRTPSHLRELDMSDNDLQDEGVELLCVGLRGPQCKLETLRLSKCGISDEGYVLLALTLMSNPSCVKELHVSNNHPGESAQKLLSATLEDPHRKVEAIQLDQCHLSKASCEMMASVLQKTPSHLRELDMSDSDLQDEGVKLLCVGLREPQCRLETLRLSKCGISDEGYVLLALTLMSNPSCVKDLDVSNNHPGESAQKLLSATLEDPHRKVEAIQLNQCHLSKASCEIMASVLQRTPSHLRELDMSGIDLQDEGVELLCVGLRDPQCRLEILRLSLCLITHEGCSLLSSALKSNPSYLKQLDLSYNHPGDSGVRELMERVDDPNCKLETFRYDHGGEFRIKPGPRKYACELTLDPNTAHRVISLSEGNRKVTRVSEWQLYPDHPERFDIWVQVLCGEGLTGRCYWEAEWSGERANIAVAYKSMQRKGESHDSEFGENAKSWNLYCSSDRYAAWHNNKRTAIPAPSSRSSRVGVYLDWPAGTLSFYSVSSNTLTHLHTSHSTFTEPLYPGFGLDDSSMSLCQIT